jgi:RNA polymerase sigma-70 factor (ECF subfamily)
MSGPAAASGHPHDRLERRFAAACRSGDTASLVALLAADAVAVTDTGGAVRAAVHPVHGADRVARFVAALLAGQTGSELATESVNGRTGLVVRRTGRAIAVISLGIAEAEVTTVWIVLNPDKLTSWHRR